MNKLSISAKKTFLLLLLGNGLIILASLILLHYFFLTAQKPTFPPRTISSIIKLAQQLQAQPESNWQPLLAHKRIPWTTLTLSATPLYRDNAVLNIRPRLIYDLLKQENEAQVSVFIKEKAWLNIHFKPPQPNPFSLIAALVVCILFLLIALISLHYWAIKTLIQPTQVLLQSLQYNERQEQWLPIPLTGNADQILLFERINALQAKMNRLLQNRTQVFTAISHDLRTPLTRLKLRLEYLTGHSQYTKMMHDINDMEGMIRETLDYFKEEHQEEARQRFDLIALLQSLCEDAADLQFKVHFQSTENKVIFLGTVNHLKRAFSNLINNAIYYGHEAYISVEQTADRILITIEDRGEGLNEKELEQAFLPFYRAETSRSRATGGTGLGLTIAKEIIQLHQGTIELSNRREGGLRVFIALPKPML